MSAKKRQAPKVKANVKSRIVNSHKLKSTKCNDMTGVSFQHGYMEFDKNSNKGMSLYER